MKQMECLTTESLGAQFGTEVFEQIIRHAPVAIIITDQAGNILMVNDHLTDITGYSGPELLGQNCSILSYKTTPESVYQTLWRTISEGGIWQGQLINRKKDGSLYIADLSISGFKNQQGEQLYYAMQSDITEKHKLMVHQKNQSALFQAVLDSAPIAIVLVDKHDKVLFSNKRYDKLAMSLEPEPVSLLSDLLRTEHGYDSIDAFLGSRARRSQSIHLEETRMSAEKWFDFSLEKIPVSDTTAEAYFAPADDYYTVIGILDRTREKLYLEEKRLNTITLMASDNKFVHSMQEAMMATLHQLQGPLNMIDSAVTILKQNNHSCPGLVAMDEAMSNALLALEDIKQAIPERENEASQSVNLNQLIRDTVSISTERLLSSSTHIELRLTPTLSSFNAKPHRLLLAIKQLIDNALDAIQSARSSSRTILITTRENNDEITFSIEDSGAGIAEELRLKIFQPFYSSKSKARSGCRGIGLAIVQQVVNEHAASLQLDKSQRLGGARIRLIFNKSS